MRGFSPFLYFHNFLVFISYLSVILVHRHTKQKEQSILLSESPSGQRPLHMRLWILKAIDCLLYVFKSLS